MYVSKRMRGIPYFHIQHQLLSRCVDWRYRDSLLEYLRDNFLEEAFGLAEGGIITCDLARNTLQRS